MKGKWKYLLYIVIVLDLVYIGFYGYNKYIRIPMSRTSRAAVANPDTTSVSTEFILPFDYGDTVKNHVLTDVAGEIIDISPANNNFKFLNIIQISNPDKINIDYFSTFIDIRKEFINKEIEFLYINIGEFSLKKKKELSKFQEKFNINICSISTDLMKKLYKLSNCKCGYIILLDNNNQVRFANTGTGMDIDSIILILKKELERVITNNDGE